MSDKAKPLTDEELGYTDDSIRLGLSGGMPVAVSWAKTAQRLLATIDADRKRIAELEKEANESTRQWDESFRRIEAACKKALADRDTLRADLAEAVRLLDGTRRYDEIQAFRAKHKGQA